MANERAAHALTCGYKPNHQPEDCPNQPPMPTTAQFLGAYRRELLAEGIDPDEIRLLVIEAARTLLRHDDLRVSKSFVEVAK